MDSRRTLRASSRQPVDQPRNQTIGNINTTTTNNNNPAATAAVAATTTTTNMTRRRTRSRSNTPAPAPAPVPAAAQRVPALSTSTPALQPALATISEGASRPDEAGPSSTTNNNPTTTTTTTSNIIRKPRANHPRPANRPVNPLDAPLPSFSTRQQEPSPTTTTHTNTNTTATAAAQIPQTTALAQTTGPALSLFSQPPPAFSQPLGTFGGGGAAPFNTTFGGTPLNTNRNRNTSFGGAPLNTLFGSAAFTTARGGGGATAANRSTASFISTLSSPTASGNFRDVSTVLPETRTLPTTTALNAPRDSRPHIISDDEEPDDDDGDGDEFSRQLRAGTSRVTGPQLHRDTSNYLLHNTTTTTHNNSNNTTHIIANAGGDGDEEDEEASHYNALYPSSSSSRRRIVPRSAIDRPAPLIPLFDKELEFYREMHAGGEESPLAGGGGGAGKGKAKGVIGGGNISTGAGAGVGVGVGIGVGGEGGRRRRQTAIPSRGRGGAGRSQKLTRSGPTVSLLMGDGGGRVETSVSYGAAAAAAVAADDDTSRGRDAGGVGPHRHSRRRASPVGMSSHPYAFSGLTPSSTSSGNTNTNAAAAINNPTTTTTNFNTNVTGNARGLGIANASASLEGNAGDASAGPATQIWRTGFGVLGGDIDDDNDDDDVPSRANRSLERSRALYPASLPRYPAGLPRHPASNHSVASAAENDPVVTDDEEKAKQMADERRKGKWQREAEARKVQRRSAKGLGPATPKKLGRYGSDDDDNDRTPTQASQQIPAFSVAPAPVASISTSQGAPGVGGVVPKKSGRPGLWKSGTAKSIGVGVGGAGPSAAEDVVEETENRSSHTRTNTVASGSNQTVISRLDSAVSQLPALPGIPGSFEGLSGIGGQNELGVSQFEESLPAFRYNSRRTGPALSTIHTEEDDNVAVGASFNPYADLESQIPTRPHSDIIYNTSGNPVARSSGEALRSEPSEILEPILRPLPDEIFVPAAQPPVASGSYTSQSTTSSQGRKKIRFGSYDPADDLITWDNPTEPNRDPSETTGPQLFTPEQEELQRRVKNILRGDDHAGNLAYGRSKQTILDSVVRPVSEIRAASTSASPTRDVPAATGPFLATTTGSSIGDDPANPLIIDGDPPSPTMSEIRRAGRHYVRTIVMPDRDRRLRGVHSDDEEMQGVGAPAPLPTYQLPSEGSELGEEEVIVEDDAQPQPEQEPRPNGTVLVPNSSGSAVADDNDVEDLDPENTQEKPIIGEWHEDQLDEVSLEDKMEGLFPARSFISDPPLDTTPLGQALARQSSSTQPSMSSVGDIPDNPLVNYSALYPPNQEAYMKMHAADVSDAETEPSVYHSQPVRQFDTNFTPFSDGDILGETAGDNPPSNRPASYPHPDNLSISTDNSVLRSQLYSSKLMAYNAEQAGLKPGDEGYTEPPEENYVKWARAEGFSDAASTETAPSVAPVKGKKTFGNPFLGLLVRMPRASETQLSEEETSRPSGESLAVIPDSQGEPPLLSQPASAPKVPSTSTKSTDPRRRPAPVIANGIHADSQAGPSTIGTSQLAKNRTARQATSARPYVSSPVLSMRSQTPPELFSARARRPATDSLPLPGTSQAPSEAEAQIEAELIPETQFSQQISHASSPSLGTYSPVIRYENYFEGLSEEPRRSSRRIPTVLVPGTASPSQASNIISREPSAVATQPRLEDEGDTDEEGLIELSAAPQEDSFGLSGTGGQNEWVPETQHSHVETQNEPTDSSVPAPTIPSFELPDPALATAEPQQSIIAKRKRDEEPTEPVEDLADKPSPRKKARKVPAPPVPLPIEPTESMRRTRSLTRLSSKPPASHGPLATPVPPARLSDAGRYRKLAAVPHTPLPQRQRKTALSSIIEASSPLSPLPPSPTPAREETISPTRRSKSYLKGRTLVPDSSASQVDEGEVPGASGERAETQTSGTQATQDPFKSLARSVSKSRLGRRKANVASVDPFSTAKSIAPARPSTRKRAREEPPEEDVPSIRTDFSPPPSKKHRREASVSKPKKALVTAAASKQPKHGATFVSSARRACQRGGRVFAQWNESYYTATVKDSWEDEDEIRCQVQFDDKTWAELLLSELYRCELQEGDKIMVPGPKSKTPAREGYVSAVPLWEDRHRVSVRLASIPQEEVAIFDGKKIMVDAKYAQKEWKERKATCLEDIGLGEELVRVQQEKERKEAEAKAIGRTIPSAAFLGPPRWKDSPPPPPRLPSLPSRGRKRPPQATDMRPRLEAPWTTESSSRKPFAGHAIIHALAVNDDKGNPLAKDQRTAQKQELTANIERLGGKVVNSFGELLQWGGKTSDDADRWAWKAGAIKYVEEEPSATTGKRGKRTPVPTTSEPPKIFLVADGPNRATKYLMALAAGIPCVDQGWIRDENAAPWHAYLLSAGQSPSLGHTCSQWVDHSYSDHPRTLKTLLDEPGPVHKAFDDKTILFLYPSRSGSEIDEDQVVHTYAYAALACLMGASRVEVVHDLDAASRDLAQYDAIVHEDESLPVPLTKFSRSKKGKNVICTDINWVRDCLITGTFLRHSK